MKVFISSLITGYEEFRAAAADATRSLGHEVTVAEDYGAAPESPQIVCLRGVRDADVVILLLGSSYGHVQDSGKSATHEEYIEAREHGNVLAFVQDRVDREPIQEQFVQEVRGWTGHLTASYRFPDELRGAVTRALHEFELSRATGRVDEDALLRAAVREIPSTDAAYESPVLQVIVAGGPAQQVIRPAQIDSAALVEQLEKLAFFGSNRVLDAAAGTKAAVRHGALILDQGSGLVQVGGAGTVRVTQGLVNPSAGMAATLGVVVEEDLKEAMNRSVGFSGEVLELVDPERRLSDVVVVAAITGTMTLGIKTRAELAASPGTVSINPRVGRGPIAVHLTPARMHRLALANEPGRIAEDLAVLIRRELQVVSL